MKLLTGINSKINIETTINKEVFTEIDEFIKSLKENYPVKAAKVRKNDGDTEYTALRVSAGYPMSTTIEASQVKVSEDEIYSSVYAYAFSVMDKAIIVRSRWDYEDLLEAIVNEWIVSDELLSNELYKEYKAKDLVEYSELKVGVQSLDFFFGNLSGEWVEGRLDEEINEILDPKWVKHSMTSFKHPEFPIRFVDTYRLFNTSLKDAVAINLTGKELQLVNHFEYDKSLVRTQSTVLTKSEQDYLSSQVLGLNAVLSNYCEIYNTTWVKLPATQAGCAKREAKSILKGNTAKERQLEIAALLNQGTPNIEQLSLIKESLTGGLSAINEKFKNKRVEGPIGHVDFASKHPASMMFEKYPVGKNFPLDKDLFIKLLGQHDEGKGFIVKLMFTNVKLKDGVIAPYKVVGDHDKYLQLETEGGKLKSAKIAIITLNSVDFELFAQQYDFEIIEFREGFAFRMDYIYDEFRGMLGEMYKEKTELKHSIKATIDTEAKERLQVKYLHSKVKINSQFGQTAKTPIYSQPKLEMKGTLPVQATAKFVNVEGAMKKYQMRNFSLNRNTGRYELALNDIYDVRWGTFTTAYSHIELIDVINRIGADSWLKSDTDSAFYIKETVKEKDFINTVNNNVARKASISGLSEEQYKVHGLHIGFLEEDKDAAAFIARGPKNHQEIGFDGKVQSTNSGISKAVVNRLTEVGHVNYEDDVIEIDAKATELFDAVIVSEQPIGLQFEGYDGTIGELENENGVYLRPRAFTIN